MPADDGLTFASARGRWVLLGTVLGSAMASIDATVVGIALPAIGRDFDTGLADAAVGGHRVHADPGRDCCCSPARSATGTGGGLVFLIGVVWFAAASALCGFAPDAPTLIAARALQGVGAALLTPGSLAIIEASFRPADRGRAIGAWSGLSGVATAIGPFLGGWLVQAVSWRLIFVINLPVAAAVVAVAGAARTRVARHRRRPAGSTCPAARWSRSASSA